MIIIADSGSTKTQWAIVPDNAPTLVLNTDGINPIMMSGDDITKLVRQQLVDQWPENITLPHDAASIAIHFYGAGCLPHVIDKVREALGYAFGIDADKTIEVASDMLGAARALFGNEAGIACIMGTGSNSCAYDGKEITANVSPLGFILGDEGSGAVLGRTLVGDVLKNQLPEEIIEDFHKEYALTRADFIERVYRQPLPNRFLASFAPFLAKHLAHPAIHKLVVDAFRRFLVRNVAQYDNAHALPIGFVGSVAHHFRPCLEEALKAEDMHAGAIVQAPLERLVAFHCG